MSMFKTETIIPVSVPDLSPAAHELAGHFEQRAYQVECIQVNPGAWEVGITRGGFIKAALGLKSALKIQIEACPTGTVVRAGAGIFGKQAIPTAITMLVAWPVIFPQIWGMIREAGLDDEAVRVVELSLKRAERLGGSADPETGAGPAGAKVPARGGDFCTNCGEAVAAPARFCPGCGQARAS